VYDSAKAVLALEKIDNYLFTRGYFKSKTTLQLKEKGKRVAATYIIEPGPAFIYDTIFFSIPDSTMAKLVHNSNAKTFLKVGENYDQSKVTKEIDRIDLLLKDKGYYDFSKQYIDFEVDTSYKKGHKIALKMEISMPARRDYHKQFRVDSVIFTPDASVKGSKVKRRQRVYNNVTFNAVQDEFSKRILAQRIFIMKDSLYSRTKTFNTQRQLANLDIFKFININYDTTGGKFIANIFSSPLDRYGWSNETGVTVTQGFPGPYLSTNLKRRNVFKGLEILELNGRFGFEGVASATQTGNFYRSTEATGNASVSFPQFLFPFSKAASNRYAQYNPRTKLLGGYTYTDRPEYTRGITTLSATYTWDLKQRLQFSYTPASLNIIRSHISDAFNDRLQQLKAEGNNLINSFKPSYVSSMIFAMTYNPNNYGNLKSSSFYLRVQAESGGTLFNFYTPKLITHEGLEVYKYLRLNVDIRRNEVIDKNTVLAYRINSGVAYSYSASKALPYEKYFFVGGSNSVRAWRPRRLGVGSYPVALSSNPNQDGLFDYKFEKPGEILLEGSIELRKKLFGFVNGAVFVDAGNVWTFKQQDPQTGDGYATWTGNTKFNFNEFYKEFGVGTGFGLRFDFTFLILRLDVGMKAYDPARPEGQRFILTKSKFWSPYGTGHEPVIYNVGIGYPF
jgi:outer membrane protein assembly factor BamA